MKVVCFITIGLITLNVINCGSNSGSNNKQGAEVIVYDPFDRYYNDYNYNNDYYGKDGIERRNSAVHFSEFNSDEDVQYNHPDEHENFNNPNHPVEYKQHSSKFNNQDLKINKRRNLHPSTQKLVHQPIQENTIQSRQIIVNKDDRQQSNINTRQFP